MSGFELDRSRTPRWITFVAWGGCLLTTLVFLGFKQFSYRYVAGDENIYYYMAKIMAEGKAWPYRDFFFAHPPVQLFVAAGAFKVFGATYAVARTLPILSAAASGLAIFLIARRRFGLFEAVVSQAAFLFSYGILRNSSHFTGANLSTALVLWGFYLLLRRKDVGGGLVLALAAHTTVYAVPGVAMVLLWRFLKSPRGGIRSGVAMVGGYLLVTVAMLLLGGGSYIEGVFTYHLNKKLSPDSSRAGVFLRVFRFHNFYLSWGAVLAMCGLLWWRKTGRPVVSPAAGDGAGVEDGAPDAEKTIRRKRKTGRGRPASQGTRFGRFIQSRPAFAIGLLLYVGVYLLWLMRLREFYDFYFVVLFPPLALLLGYAVGEVVAGPVSLIRKRAVLPCVRSAVLVALLAVGYGTIKTSQVEEFFSDREPDNPPKPQDYVWFDAPSLGPINRIYRGLFWKDRRDPQRAYPGQVYYLWHEMRHLEELGAAVDFVRDNSEPGDTVFGESGLAPLVAFLADRDVAGHVADTNTKRFSSGQTTVQAMLERIDTPDLRFVVASRAGRGYRYVNQLVTNWLEKEFRPVHEFRSGTNPGTTWYVLERDLD